MPTYEYECLTDRHRFEVKQSFADPSLDECQVCGDPVRKVFSAAGIVFKGSGYYVTDTRKSPSEGSGSADKSDAGKGGDPGSGNGSNGKGSGDKASDKKSGGGDTTAASSGSKAASSTSSGD